MSTPGELINHGYMMAQGDVHRVETAAFVDNMRAKRRINSLAEESANLRQLLVNVLQRVEGEHLAWNVERQGWEVERQAWEMERQAWQADRANLLRLLKASVAEGDRLRATNEEQRLQISRDCIELDRLTYVD